MSTPETLPGQGGDFAKGASGAANVYDTSPTGLGINPAYLAGGASASATSSGGGSSTTGIVVPFAGSSAPTGYVLCDGSTYDGTNPTYAALYAVIGTTYGGSGIAAFKVPDLQGRIPVGLGTNADVSALGNNDGVAVGNRRPKHRHTAHTHTVQVSGSAGGTTIAAPGSTFSANQTSGATDGGSGTSTDSLDAPAYLVLHYLIAL